jgi:opacity protein-like surface antigen
MRRYGIQAVSVALAMLGAAATANAQMATVLKPVQIGVAVGGSFPLGNFGTNFNTGFNLTGTVGINPVGLPVGFRIDGSYNQFGSKGTPSVNAKIAGVSGNVLLNVPGGVVIAPYVIGGVGYYRVSSSATGTAASNNFGFNAGAGVRIPLTGFMTFIEARYTRITESGGSTSFVPVTVGIMF